MGCASSVASAKRPPPGPDFSTSTIVSAGQHAAHFCFVIALRLDFFQPLYAMHPLVYTVTPCLDQEPLYGKYGVGTKFSTRPRVLLGDQELLGDPEVLTITQMTYPTLVIFNSGTVEIAYNINAQSPEVATFSVSVRGPRNGGLVLWKIQLEAMQAFIVANVAQILADHPPDDLSFAPNSDGEYVKVTNAQHQQIVQDNFGHARGGGAFTFQNGRLAFGAPRPSENGDGDGQYNYGGGDGWGGGWGGGGDGWGDGWGGG